MENLDEEARLEWKTDSDIVREQATWCGMKPGCRVLDAGCGTGKTSSIFFDMVQDGGEVVGIDFSDRRIGYAREHYGGKGLSFERCDITKPLDTIGKFDVIWIRFVLEYFRKESALIVKNLSECLKQGGYLCLIDLDHNSLNHYELPRKMEDILYKLIERLSADFNFDPYCGRKLYSYLYDVGLEDISLKVNAHHLIYGELRDVDAFNWLTKLTVSAGKVKEVFQDYQGGYKAFSDDFQRFFSDPRRFTYTPLIMCKGRK